MKRVKNFNFAPVVKNKYCAVSFIENRYQYVIIPLVQYLPPFIVFKSKKKSKIVNKYTLTVVSFVLNCIFRVLWPLILVIGFIVMWFKGLLNFIIKSHDITYEGIFVYGTIA